ncbi:type III secretion protein [Burkholderia mallei PRL-20]|nr:type III secretion protein [Burkholderia mallei GB8 horse 4]EES46630.1 type III secretion protein [Burkholderia mallei PRL-20]
MIMKPLRLPISAAGARRAARLAALVACVALFAGCRQELYGGLAERDCNEMMAALLQNGVDAQKKTPDGGKTWTLAVDDKQIVKAMEVLRARAARDALRRSRRAVQEGRPRVDADRGARALHLRRVAGAVGHAVENRRRRRRARAHRAAEQRSARAGREALVGLGVHQVPAERESRDAHAADQEPRRS